MRQLTGILALLVTIFTGLSCQQIGGSDEKISLIFLQLNDVYEIAPIQGGKVGGMARVATIRKQLLEENPNTYTILSGDFLNPSVIGTMKFEGQRINGRQMVEVMNATGIDLVTFGNHEFDLNEQDLQQRLNESEFAWVSTNVRQNKGDYHPPFAKVVDGKAMPVPETYTFDATDSDGTTLKIGLFGVTLAANRKDYVYYQDVDSMALKAVVELKASTDLVLGITHLELEDDLKLAAKIPEVKLLMGGHDHDNMYESAGESFVAKADANAKTVYVHRITFDKKTGIIDLKSELVPVTDEIAEDSATAVVVRKWTARANKSFVEQGFDPDKVLTVVPEDEPWDGRESSIRHHQTNLGEVITTAMKAAASSVDAVIMNSGSVRVDDQLSGNITEFDIIRTLPFGGAIVEIAVKGSTLNAILDTGLANKGTGGYLQWGNITHDTGNGQWMVDGKALQTNTTYRVAVTEFLMTGQETGLAMLTPDNPLILEFIEPDPADMADPRHDIRTAVIKYLESGESE